MESTLSVGLDGPQGNYHRDISLPKGTGGPVSPGLGTALSRGAPHGA